MRGCKHTCLLAEQSRGKNFILYKPNIGKQSQPESLDSLQKKYRRVGGSCSPPVWREGKASFSGQGWLWKDIYCNPFAANRSPAVDWAEVVVAPGCPDSQPWISSLSCTVRQWKISNAVWFLLQVLPEEAKEHWENSYHFSLKKCNHAVW